MSNKSNVSAAKPKVGGAVYIGPITATLPTSTDDTLTGFSCLGYISDAGVTNDHTPNVTTIKAWGGDEVLDIASEKSDRWHFTLIEVTNVDVLKLIYGDDNVTGTLSTGITVAAVNNELSEHAVVIDMIMRDGTAKRVVMPAASVISVGTITYSDSAAVGYETTLNAHPDATSTTHYEYIKAS